MSSSNRIKRIVIVGGGTAGWMAASVLQRSFGPLVEIELIESDQIGTVGVGEATIPQIRLLLGLLGVDERDFLKNVQGTIKLGIRFDDLGQAGAIPTFMRSARLAGRSGMLEFYHYWLRAREQGSEHSLWSYSLNSAAADIDRL